MADIRSSEKTAIFAEEDFVVEVQTFLHGLMEEKGFSRADLARAMGVSRARVTQIFSDECKNFTVRLLARAVHAMGEEPTIGRASVDREGTQSSEERRPQSAWSQAFFSARDINSIWETREMFNEMKAMLPSNDQIPKRLVGYAASPLEWEAA